MPFSACFLMNELDRSNILTSQASSHLSWRHSWQRSRSYKASVPLTMSPSLVRRCRMRKVCSPWSSSFGVILQRFPTEGTSGLNMCMSTLSWMFPHSFSTQDLQKKSRLPALSWQDSMAGPNDAPTWTSVCKSDCGCLFSFFLLIRWSY